MSDEARRVDLRTDLLDRFVNVDLSGGERKRAEIVQFGVLRPTFALLDEIDSGLDVDALGAVARRLSASTTEWGCGVARDHALSPTARGADAPTAIHVLSAGASSRPAGQSSPRRLERDGYESFRVTTA